MTIGMRGPGPGDRDMDKLCDIETSHRPVSQGGTTAIQPRQSKDFACEFAFPRLISVCSFGLIILGAHRRVDRLLDTVALLADVHDLASLD